MTSEQSVGGDLVESQFDPLEVDDDLHIDPVHSWKILGHGVADWVSVKLPEYFSHVLMFPAKATADSNYLRAALGNIWLIFPIIGVALGIMAALNVADKVREALLATIAEGPATYDLAEPGEPTCTMDEFNERVLAKL